MILMDEKFLGDLVKESDHDVYYVVDTNIVLSYCKGDVPGLCNYVDKLSQNGKRFFLTERIRNELVSVPVPPQFHVVKSDHLNGLVDRAYPVIMRDFGCTSRKFETDVKWLLEAGYCLAECADIPPVASGNDGMTFVMTGNAALIRKFLASAEWRKKFERIVDNYSLEHLADIRKLDMATGMFHDLISVPTLAQ